MILQNWHRHVHTKHCWVLLCFFLLILWIGFNFRLIRSSFLLDLLFLRLISNNYFPMCSSMLLFLSSYVCKIKVGCHPLTFLSKFMASFLSIFLLVYGFNASRFSIIGRFLNFFHIQNKVYISRECFCSVLSTSKHGQGVLN